MSIIGDRIKYRRKELNLTQEQLANKLGYKNKATIGKIETGVNDIVQSKVIDFAKALNTTPAYLMGWVDDTNNGKLIDEHSAIKCLDGVRIPVLGEIVAGLPLDAYQEILDYEEIPAALASQGEFFALKVKGDSMSPRIADGDVVICKQQSDIESGDIAVVTINGDTATLKKVVKHSTGITLVALNTAVFQPQFFTNEEVISLPITIQGKVIELRAKF